MALLFCISHHFLGHGVFAKEMIKKGEVVCFSRGDLLTKSQGGQLLKNTRWKLHFLFLLSKEVTCS